MYFPVFEYPDNTPSLKLNKEEQAELAEINTELASLGHKKLQIIRSAAKRQGIAADKLSDLKSESGRPFVEEKIEKTFKLAVVRKESEILEVAYLCFEPQNGCGWVKGNPEYKNYDDIGFLSGSAGTEYYCKICGKTLGRKIYKRS
jgi:hypothetical protein